MSDEPHPLPGAQQASTGVTSHLDYSSPSAAGRPGARALGGRRCPHCGGLASVHASVCPACGENLKARTGMIRCRYCGERSPAELALCPHCGRELASAPPPVLTWGIPALLVVLFVAALASQLDGSNPVAWAQTRLSMARPSAEDGANRGFVVVMTPVPPDEEEVTAGEDAVAEAVAESDAVALAESVDDAGTDVEAAPDGEAVAAAVALSAEEPVVAPADEQPVEQTEGQPAQAAGAQPLEQPADPSAEAALAAVTETQEPEAASVALPTATPVPAATNTPPPTATTAATMPQTAQVVAASAAAGRAAAGELPTATPTRTTQPAPTSTWTPLPEPTATPAPTDTSTQTPAPVPTYQIRRGDTLIMVARRHEVSLEDLMLANNIDAQDAFTIQPGQVLVIPTGGYQPPVTPTPLPTATATPTVPPAATAIPPTPRPASAFRLDAPVLRSPESGTPMSCSAPSSLVWLPVSYMRAEDKYVLHLGFVNGRMDDGQEIVIWVLEQPRPANLTSWDMDASLCSLAPQEFGRQWRWYVEAVEEVDGKLVSISPPSETWQFSWN